MNLRFLAMSAAALASACGGDSTSSSATKPVAAPAAASASKKGAAPDEQAAHMVTAVGLGKSALQVIVKFQFASRPKPAEPLSIDIAAIPQIAAEALTLQVLPSDDLNISAVGPDLAVSPVEAGGVYRHQISVTPEKAGVLLLGLNVTLKHDDITESRLFSIPVFIADDQPQK